MARLWPTDYLDREENQIAFKIGSSIYAYDPKLAKSGAVPLSMYIAFRNDNGIGFEWKKLKAEIKSLKEAKELAEKMLRIHPE